MVPRTPYEWFVLTLRLVIGALFLSVGAYKAFFNGGLAVFAQDVSHYRILLEPWTLVLAYVLPWLEMVVGGCLLGGFLVRGAVVLAELMTLAFLFAIGQAWYFGIDLNCGCFGHSETKSNLALHFVCLLPLLAALILVERGQREPFGTSVPGREKV